jgi:hypothetical protein
MRIRKLSLLIILSLVFFTNCNSDDASNQAETLNGIWNAKNINGGLAGIDDDYEAGLVTWTFNNQVIII